MIYQYSDIDIIVIMIIVIDSMFNCHLFIFIYFHLPNYFADTSEPNLCDSGWRREAVVKWRLCPDLAWRQVWTDAEWILV